MDSTGRMKGTPGTHGDELTFPWGSVLHAFMQIWEAVTLGVVQGLTEFLPISSTAHLLVVRTAMGHENPKDGFTTAIQLGTLVAVVLYFRVDLYRMVKGLLGDFRSRRLASNPDSRLLWRVGLATLPAVVAGFTLLKWLKATFYNLPAIGAVSIVFALVLLAAEWWAKYREKRQTPRTEESLRSLDALIIGLFQAFALMPGGSRSGTTISAGLFCGFPRAVAARFSFLMSLPAIFGAGVLDLYKDWGELRNAGELSPLLLGGLVAGAVGYTSIGGLLWLLKRFSALGFVVYRIVFGFALLLWWYMSRAS